MAKDSTKGKRSATGGSPPGGGGAPKEGSAKLVTSGDLIRRTIFKRDPGLLDGIESDFNNTLGENRKVMFRVIAILIAVMLSILLVLGVYLGVLSAYNMGLMLMGSILAILLSLGLGIQVGTMLHGRISKKVNEETDAINDLIKETNQKLYQMDFIINDVLKKKEAKTTEEILNEIKIKNVAAEMTTLELREIMDILANKKDITHPEDQYTIFMVDIPEREIREYIGEEHLARVTRVGQSNLGYKTLLYIRHEFSDAKLKQIKKRNPTLRKVDMSTFLEAGSKLSQEMGKLGISFRDITPETRIWVAGFSGHERRELLAKIKKLKSDTVDLSKKLGKLEGRFKTIQDYLNTTVAVILLAVAGIFGFFIDMWF